jgi:hypothetical protein
LFFVRAATVLLCFHPELLADSADMMLRNKLSFLQRTKLSVWRDVQTRSLSISLDKHYSIKNSALITNLSPTVTSKLLKDKCQGINKKDIHLQPGCALHFLDEAEALLSAEYLSKTHKLKVIS